MRGGLPSVRRGVEVGVVGAAAVGGLGPDVVAAGAAAAVVVDLEVARGVVEPVPPQHVMDHVVGVEEVRHRRLAVGLRMLRQVGGEVEVEPRPPVGVAAEVGCLVVVLVEVRVHVVAARDRELRPVRAVGVVPSERRRRVVSRRREQRPRCVVRALGREAERPVARAVGDRERRLEGRRDLGPPDALGELVEVVVVGPVGLRQQLPGRGVDGRAPEMLVHRVVDRHVPRELDPAAARLVAEPHRDRSYRDPAVRHDGLARGLAQHAQVTRLAETELLRRCVHGRNRVQPGALGAARDAAHKAAAREDHAAVRGDVHRRVGAEHLEPAVALVDADVRDAVVRAAVTAHHRQLGHVGARRAEFARVVADVFERDVARIRGADLSGRPRRAKCYRGDRPCDRCGPHTSGHCCLPRRPARDWTAPAAKSCHPLAPRSTPLVEMLQRSKLAVTTPVSR